MAQTPSSRLALSAALLAALALSACGVKGPPEPPPGGAQAIAAEEAQKAGQKVDTSQPVKPDRKLLIDKLL